MTCPGRTSRGEPSGREPGIPARNEAFAQGGAANGPTRSAESGESCVVAVTGAASGIGAATAARLTEHGHRVIGVDLRDADVEADLGTADGRQEAIGRITELCDGALDGLVTCAGLAGLPDRPASLLISVNYFGTVELLAGLRDVSRREPSRRRSRSARTRPPRSPGYRSRSSKRASQADEAAARALAGEGESLSTYAVTKLALARWIRVTRPRTTGRARTSA